VASNDKQNELIQASEESAKETTKEFTDLQELSEDYKRTVDEMESEIDILKELNVEITE